MSTISRCPSCGARNRLPPPNAREEARCARCHSPLPWLADAADGSFDAILAGSTLPVLVDCWAEWCGPCHALAPVIERAATRHAGRLKVIKLDVDGAHLVASRLGIRSVPTLLLYRDGRLADRRAGAVGDAALDHWLAQQGVG